jgi:asparagine synthase (glutamine-hydrolysing)
MCGITGIFNTNSKPISLPILKQMTDIIKHRGPDSEGFWYDSFIGFGHRRLSIIDLSPLASQPMSTDNGRIVITYNGEIYNFQNLRIELESRGHSFKSRSDTEVVLKAYKEWGKDCVSKFNGMFAFAIWDKNINTLLLFRDRYGIKPLYYYKKDGIFLFSSEIKSFLKHPDFSVNVCIPAMSEYFSFQNIFSNLTLFEDVKLLQPANILSVELNKPDSLKCERYWDFDFKDSDDLTEIEYVNELKRLFEQAVNRQLISDVEIGSYLSGGLDSGSITCIASKTFKNLKTFTCGFDLSSASGLELSFDERKKAESLSNIYKTEHYEVVLKAGDMERVMEELIWHLEDLRVGQSYPNFYVSRLASKFVKVVLSGAGGDELFAGYPWRYYRAIVNDDTDHYVDKYYKYWQRIINDKVKNKFFQPELQKKISDYSVKQVFRKVINGKALNISSPEEYLNRSLYFEIKTFLHGLLLVEDKLSMAHGLETRVPFLDNDLVDFSMKVPVKYKLKNLTKVIRMNENVAEPKRERYYKRTSDGKLILRNVLSHYVPLDYSKGLKQGFAAPDSSWFKGESIDYIKNLLFDKRARIYDYIQPSLARDLMNEHFEGRTNRRLLIWSLLCFEWWNRIFK